MSELVLERATEVFGDPSTASGWLAEECAALRGATPLQAAVMDAGLQEVLNILGRIQHGVIS